MHIYIQTPKQYFMLLLSELVKLITCRRNGMRIIHPLLNMPSLWLLNFMSQVGDNTFHCVLFKVC